ncbi:ATP-binding protein [Hyalangium sp.]|uniref:hybrid sensor histidine kinase/response regulator n=1 Tax=Hyalangium sp. TaxID=2028555 RepID=UPI002D2BDB87|nr:ATP-binding protein [Hyalangium sp.]HYH95519.1 ATP-binding protein [Hyalangium sp.]
MPEQGGGKKTPFIGPSEMHVRVSAHDWAATPVGPVETWPQSLKSTVKTLLSSRYPMILLWGAELIQIYNEAYIGLIGDKHPGALGRSIRETQSESWEVIGPMIHEVISTGIPNWVPAQMLPLERAGYREESYFSLSYSAVDDDEGRIAGMLCVCSEVTQQVLGERRTRLLRDLAIKAGETQSVEKTCLDIEATMASHSFDVPFALLYLREPDGKTLALAAGIGLQRGAHAAPTVARPDSEDGVMWPLGPALRGKTVLVERLEQGLALTGGPWKDAAHSALVMPIASAEPGATLGVLVAGISPNRELDEGYRSFYELFAGQVSVALRNARSYEDERKRAEALAELDRAKTAFFSNVSHEFRTPLTLMLGPLEDALSDMNAPLPPSQRERLALVLRNGNRLFKLVNTLLDYSRLEAGRAKAKFQPVDLSSLTTQLVNHFESAARRAGLTLTVECPPLSEPVWVDIEAWQKVVFNLLSNALKYTFSGGVSVSLREQESQVLLRVHDTGTGISPEELPHIFERFHRVEGARARSHEGSGIGLALVKELVGLHKGRVDVDSEGDRGSVFTISLPLGHGHLPADQRAVPGAQAAEAETARADSYVQEVLGWLRQEDETPSLQGDLKSVHGESTQRLGRVLVADDNADLRDYLTRTLSPLFEVEAVADGQAALEAVRVRAPDLVVTDVMMPRLGGFGLLRALREAPETRALPVVMLSARAGEEAAIEGMEAGADDYLAKPFSARELLARVRTALELSRMRRNLARQEALAEGLREAVRARDAFLSVAGHELKTPLAVFRLQLELLERGLSPESHARLAERFGTAARQVGQLSSLVEGLLVVSELAAGRLELRRSEVNLSALVQEVAAGMNAEFARVGCSVTLRVEPEVVAPCDGPRIAHVLASLLRQAMRGSPACPLEVSLLKEGAAARLSVTGHGRDLSPEDRARIFGDFERAVPTQHYSTGLEVWIARQVVQAHAGVFEVTDTPGGGATFHVLLPLLALGSGVASGGQRR